MGAKEMHEGLVLYRDFWDIKQPGIFYFFLVGGKLFGFNEFGIHLLELLYWIFFCVILIWFLAKYIFKDKLWLAAVSSLLVVGSYYICAGTGKLTQVEALANFPLLMIVVFNYLYLISEQNRNVWLLLSGIAAGAVILLKLIFLPILGFLYILLVVRSFRNNRSISLNLAEIFIVAAGFIIACLPFIIYCIKYQIGNLVLETFFITPTKVIAQAEHKSIQHLIVSVLGFFPRIAFVVLVFLYGAYHFRKNPFVQDMIAWVTAGLFVILIQRTSWWGYHSNYYMPLWELLLLLVLKESRKCIFFSN
ncbi:MAG: glycosyltransferase family 39 protein [Bacteroidales bacterium]|nr:glycosyltransferase family 39 protein [Bacteroidales bacterium]